MTKKTLIAMFVLALVLVVGFHFTLGSGRRWPTRYYAPADFDQHGEGIGGCMHSNTLRKIDKWIDKLGFVPHINSGARTSEHNQSVGGVAGSSHIVCRAADFSSVGYNQDSMVQAAKEVGFTRIGIYATHIHLDDDPSKSDAIWYG